MCRADNTRVLWLWVGAEVPKATLESLFVSRGQPPNAQLALSPKALQLWAIVNRVGHWPRTRTPNPNPNP